MPLQLTSAGIAGLVSDASSLKAGHALSKPYQWKSYGASESAIWGECLGTGSSPYQTAIDCRELAFRCSCPSRKFPCKHSIGLLLMYQTNQASFSQNEIQPSWVSEWLNKRQEKVSPRGSEVSGKVIQKNNSADNSQRRSDQRFTRVDAGVDELKIWLRDLVRQGFADLPHLGYRYWDNIAARMVDCQAPGAARRLREMSEIPLSGTGWQYRLLSKLSTLHLLIEAYGNRDELPASIVADIKNALGWTVSQDDLSSQNGLIDRWLVIGQRTTDEDRLRARRVWLMGEKSAAFAVIIHFAHGNTPFPINFLTGTVLVGELVYYPSTIPQRALIKELSPTETTSIICPTVSLTENMKAYTSAVTALPWLERFPFLISNAIPVVKSDGSYILDNLGQQLPVSKNYDRIWQLAAESGSHKMNIFGEWDGEAFWPLSLVAQGSVTNL